MQQNMGQGTVKDLQDLFASSTKATPVKKLIPGQVIDLKLVQFNPKQVVDLLSVPIYNSIIGGEYIEVL